MMFSHLKDKWLDHYWPPVRRFFEQPAEVNCLGLVMLLLGAWCGFSFQALDLWIISIVFFLVGLLGFALLAFGITLFIIIETNLQRERFERQEKKQAERDGSKEDSGERLVPLRQGQSR